MTHPALRTPLCDLLGIEHPIVQTGMGWVAGASLASATSAAGGLGILASATMSYEETRASPFAVRSIAGGSTAGSARIGAVAPR